MDGYGGQVAGWAGGWTFERGRERDGVNEGVRTQLNGWIRCGGSWVMGG